jgi:hypothetical protein
MDVAGRIVAEGFEDSEINLTQFGLAEQTYSLRLTSMEYQISLKLVYLKQ